MWRVADERSELELAEEVFGGGVREQEAGRAAYTCASGD